MKCKLQQKDYFMMINRGFAMSSSGFKIFLQLKQVAEIRFKKS